MVSAMHAPTPRSATRPARPPARAFPRSALIRAIPGDLVAAVTFLLALLPASVQAQDDERRAVELAAEGERVWSEEQDGERAVRLYLQAFELQPDPAFAHNIGAISELSGELGRAHRWYRRYLLLFPEAPNAPDIRAALDEIEWELDHSWAPLVVESIPEHAVVSLIEGDDLEWLGETPLEAWLRPDAVRIRVDAPGHIPEQIEVFPVVGVRDPVTVELVPLEEEEPERDVIAPVEPIHADSAERSIRLLHVGLAAIGVGTVVAGTGVTFLVLSDADEQDLEELRDLPDADPDEISELETRAEDRHTIGVWLSGLGGATLLGGVIAVMADEGASTRRHATLYPVWMAGGGGFVFAGTLP